MNVCVLICLMAAGVLSPSFADPTDSQAALVKTFTTLGAVPYHEAGLTNRTCGKGFILTVRQFEKEWFFILYPNFNRGARRDERTFSKGLAHTKNMLETVARGQQVYWLPKSSTNAPPDDVLDELKQHCKTVGLWPDGFPNRRKPRQQSDREATSKTAQSAASEASHP